MPDDDELTMEAEARRYEQIRSLERELARKDSEITAAKEELKDLNKEWDAILTRLRAAARNEGDLPLFMGEQDAGPESDRPSA